MIERFKKWRNNVILDLNLEVICVIIFLVWISVSLIYLFWWMFATDVGEKSYNTEDKINKVYSLYSEESYELAAYKIEYWDLLNDEDALASDPGLKELYNHACYEVGLSESETLNNRITYLRKISKDSDIYEDSQKLFKQIVNNEKEEEKE